MPSIFTRIIQGELPAYKVGETENYLAFLDIQPLVEGHTLVIPKKEVDDLFSLDEETYVGLMLFAKLIAQAIQKALPCPRVGMAVVGFEVPHAHIHLVPLHSISDLSFEKPRLQLSEDRFTQIAQALHQALLSLSP
ncbi:MAG: HIT family protein [Bacteroidia bacterium]